MWHRLGARFLLVSFSVVVLALGAVTCTGIGAASAEDLKVGALFTLTGYGAKAGQSELHGAELAAEDINAAGGVQGRKIKLYIEDCQSDLKQTASAFLKLAESDGVLAVLGPNWAEFSEVAASLSSRSKTVMITSSGYSPTLTSGRPFAFTLVESHREILESFAAKIASGHYRRIALVLNSSSYLESLHQALEELFKDQKVGIWKTFALDPSATDMRAIITQLNRDEVDAVVVFLQEGAPLGSFFRQAHDLKLKSAVYSANTLQFDDAMMKNLMLAEGAVVFDYRAFDAEDFHRRYVARFGSEPIPNAYKSYDSLFLLKDAIERCGMEKEKLAACVASARVQGITGTVEFTPERHVRVNWKVSKLLRVSGGKLIPLEE